MAYSKSDLKPPLYDFRLLFPVLFLVGVGIVMVYSASSALALNKFGSDSFFLKKQAAFAVLGVLALLFFRHIPLKTLRKLSYPLLFLSFALLIAVHIPGLGLSAGGAARWLRFGGLTFQPAELARFALIIYLAYSLSKKKQKIENFAIGLLPHILVLAALALLILLQPDFGTVVILGVITWVMMFTAGARLFHLSAPLLVLIPAAYYIMIHASYRINRIKCFLDPWQCPEDSGYQLIHSFMAFGTGGIWGTGIGGGYQKLFYLPEPHTDFIFSVIGEELGLLGVLLIICLYALVIYRGINIAFSAKEAFASYLALGFSASLALQVCINMGVTLALLPTKGLTLPFISYGGTSLLMNMAAVGVIMKCGDYRERG